MTKILKCRRCAIDIIELGDGCPVCGGIYFVLVPKPAPVFVDYSYDVTAKIVSIDIVVKEK